MFTNRSHENHFVINLAQHEMIACYILISATFGNLVDYFPGKEQERIYFTQSNEKTLHLFGADRKL